MPFPFTMDDAEPIITMNEPEPLTQSQTPPPSTQPLPSNILGTPFNFCQAAVPRVQVPEFALTQSTAIPLSQPVSTPLSHEMEIEAEPDSQFFYEEIRFMKVVSFGGVE